MSSYSATIEKLFQFGTSQGVKFGLANMEAMGKALDFPFQDYPCIHIAGSNGKGSVTTKIAKALELSGYRVGLYTSPHLYSFRERIMINSEMITEQAVVAGLEEIFALQSKLGIQSTFFELATILAFQYFRKEKIDIAVIETGLGGRLDATNVITPILSVITSISCEHTQLLGSDPESIAFEKAGILKANIPVVLGPYANQRSIFQRAQELNCSILLAPEEKGFFDKQNQKIAKTALLHLRNSLNLTLEAIEKALEVRPPCRFETIGPIIFDVAHNPDAFDHLIEALRLHYPHHRKKFVVGLCQDKEYASCLKAIAEEASHIYLVQAATPRAAKIEALALALEDIGYHRFSQASSIKEAIQEGSSMLSLHGELLIICGSFYLMKEAKDALGMYQPSDLLGFQEKSSTTSFNPEKRSLISAGVG